MTNNKQENTLIKYTYSQAKNLLEKYEEFYPFAMGIDEDLNLFSINNYSSENPDIGIHIENLIKAIKVSINDNKLFAVTLCVNVKIIPPYDDQKLDSIEIRINNKLFDSVNYYIPYEFKKCEIRIL